MRVGMMFMRRRPRVSQVMDEAARGVRDTTDTRYARRDTATVLLLVFVVWMLSITCIRLRRTMLVRRLRYELIPAEGVIMRDGQLTANGY